MSPLIFLVLTLAANVLCTPTSYKHNSTTCDEFQATFDIGSVVGTWHVVALIPEKLFPEKDVNCYRVEFSEADGGALRWLVNKTKISKAVNRKVEQIESTSLRLRYHHEQPFDVWSTSVKGVNGCFQQVLSLDVGVNNTEKAVTHDAMMQLHLIRADDKCGPFLVQMLWGRLISSVIYRKCQGVTQEDLKPVFEFISNLRGPQRLPKICENPLRNLLIF